MGEGPIYTQNISVTLEKRTVISAARKFVSGQTNCILWRVKKQQIDTEGASRGRWGERVSEEIKVIGSSYLIAKVRGFVKVPGKMRSSERKL